MKTVFDEDIDDTSDDEQSNDEEGDDSSVDKINDNINVGSIVTSDLTVGQVFWANNELQSLLPAQVLDSAHLFWCRYFAVGTDTQFAHQLQHIDLPLGNLSERQLRYKATKILDLLKHWIKYHTILYSLWLEKITSYPKIETMLNETGVEVTSDIFLVRWNLLEYQNKKHNNCYHVRLRLQKVMRICNSTCCKRCNGWWVVCQ